MAVHDVSRELRGYHGRWTKGGALMHRLAQEATAGGAQTGGMPHDEIVKQTALVIRGTGRRINGHRVDRTQKDKFRVGLLKPGGRDTKVYDTVEGAAKAIAEGQHHDEGKSSAFRKAVRPEPRISPEQMRSMSETDLRQALQIYSPGGGSEHALTVAHIRSELQRRQMETAPKSKPASHKAGDRVEIHTGKYKGESGTVIGEPSIQRPDIITVKRSDGSTIIVNVANARKATAPAPSGLSGMSDRSLELMVQRRGYNWKGAERELQARRTAQEAKLATGRPAPGSIESRIARVEASFREEGISYTPQDLVATRLDSVLADLRAGDQFITIKVPSGSEISMPRDVAQELANRARKNQQAYLRGRHY